MDRESLNRIKRGSYQLGIEAGLKQALDILIEVEDLSEARDKIKNILDTTDFLTVRCAND